MLLFLCKRKLSWFSPPQGGGGTQWAVNDSGREGEVGVFSTPLYQSELLQAASTGYSQVAEQADGVWHKTRV